MIASGTRPLSGNVPASAWAEVWHLSKVIIPRRSITGRLVRGQVWRRHDVGSTRNSSKTMSDLHSAATRCGSKIVITYSDVIAGYYRRALTNGSLALRLIKGRGAGLGRMGNAT